MASTTPVDKLIFALDGDLSALKARYAEAEAGAAKTGTVISANFNTGFKQAAAGASDHANAIKRAMGDVTGAVSGSHMAVSTAAREFRALFDELSSGRVRMAPGTLAIIATRVLGISGATLAWGAGLAAIPIGLAAAATSAESAQGRIRRALTSTGFASGQTPFGAMQLAENLDRITSLSTRGALDVLSALNAHGNIPAQLQGQIAGLVPGYAAATGGKEDEAAKKLEEVFADPAKGAAEMRDQFKALTFEQQRHIEQLEADGQHLQAMSELADLVSPRFKELGDSATSLGGIFENLGKTISDAFFNTGRAVTRGARNISETASSVFYDPAFAGIRALAPGGFSSANDAAIGRALARGNTPGVGGGNFLPRFLGGGQPEAVPFTGPALNLPQVAPAGAPVSEAQSAADRLAQDRAAELFAKQLPFRLQLEEQRNRQIEAATPVGSRAQITQQNQARIEIERMSADTKMPTALRDQLAQQITSNVGLPQREQASDLVESSNQQAKAQEAIAAAYAKSEAAGEQEEIRQKALAEQFKNSATNVGAYTDALTRSHDAERQTQAEKLIRSTEENADAQEKITAAFTESDAAGQREEIRQKAIAEAHKNSAVDVDLYTAALQRAADTEKQRSADKAVSDASDLADAQERISAAYAKSTAAGLAQTEMEKALAEHEKNEAVNVTELTAQLTREAAARGLVSEQQKIEEGARTLAERGELLGAAGSPFQTQQVTARQQAINETRPATEAAQAAVNSAEPGTPEYAKAQEQLSAAQSGQQTRITQLQSQGQVESATKASELFNEAQKQFIDEMNRGVAVTEQDISHRQNEIEVYRALIATGLDPSDASFQRLHDSIVATRDATDQLTEAQNRAKSAATEFANGITDPLTKALTSGSFKDFIPSVTQNLVGSAVKNFITQPLNQMLKGSFGDLFGANAGSADGSIAHPFYVISAGSMGGGGEPGPMGGGSLVSQFFGGNSGALDTSQFTDPSALMAAKEMGLTQPGTGGFLGNLLGPLFGTGIPDSISVTPELAGLGSSIPDAISVTPELAGLGSAAGDAAGASGILSGIGSAIMDFLPFLGLFDSGGEIGPGQWGIKSGIPELIYGGLSGKTVIPLTAPVIAASVLGRTASGTDGTPATGSTTDNSIHAHFHINGAGGNVVDQIMRSQSQIEAMVTKASARGRRNT